MKYQQSIEGFKQKKKSRKSSVGKMSLKKIYEDTTNMHDPEQNEEIERAQVSE